MKFFIMILLAWMLIVGMATGADALSIERSQTLEIEHVRERGFVIASISMVELNWSHNMLLLALDNHPVYGRKINVSLTRFGKVFHTTVGFSRGNQQPFRPYASITYRF